MKMTVVLVPERKLRRNTIPKAFIRVLGIEGDYYASASNDDFTVILHRGKTIEDSVNEIYEQFIEHSKNR